MANNAKQAARLDLMKIASSVAPPERRVHVTLDGAAMARLGEITDLLAGDTKGKERAALLAEQAELQDKTVAQRFGFRVRGLTPMTRADAFREYPEPVDGTDADQLDGIYWRITHMVAASVIQITYPDGETVDGPLHIDDMRRLRELMGEGQFETVWDAVNHAGDRNVLDSPFWQAPSSTARTS